jgi:uncharacterized protein with GYD domain
MSMATYLMFGRYSRDAVKEISAERTDKAIALIEKHGGELESGYALLGENDLLLIVDLPDTEQAMKASVALTQLLGISFTTSPAVTVEDFDRIMAEG